MTKQMDEIRKWVVNDYFTPNINAEVILDTLLTPYVAEILENQVKNTFDGKLCLITKEMSILESKKSEELSASESEESEKGSGYGNRGTKIDYVLGDRKAIYLVELKTTESSMKPEQAERYLDNCREKKFGEVFGNQLLRVMRESFADTYKKGFPEPSGYDKDEKPMWANDKALEEAFSLVFKTWYLGEKYGINVPSGQYTEGQYTRGQYARAALKLIREARWTQKDGTRSRKYFYTAGQLLDYCYDPDHPGRTLWDKPLKLIYLTPGGNPREESEEMSQKNSRKESKKRPPKNPWKEFKEKYRDFYIGSFSLKKAGEYLEKKQEDELALLLSGIIKDIFPWEGQNNV